MSKGGGKLAKMGENEDVSELEIGAARNKEGYPCGGPSSGLNPRLFHAHLACASCLSLEDE